MRLAVIGNPIAQSRSPEIQAAFAAQFQLHDFQYGRLLAPLDGFFATLSDFLAQGGDGCNVTMPFKEAAFQACQHVSERASFAGAVNTIKRQADGSLLGDNTDGVGLVSDLRHHTALQNKRVLLLGAGGAARGVVLSLAAENPACILIANRTLSKAEELAGLFAKQVSVSLESAALDAIPGSFDVVINATASSFTQAALPLPAKVFASGAVAYEMAYGKGVTPFLQQAKDAACEQCLDGLGMLVGQAAASFELWTGLRPDVEPILAQIRTGM